MGGAELVETLNEMVSQLIKENSKLKRQVDKLSTQGGSAPTGTVERGLRSLQRRVQRAVSGGTGARRRRSAAAADGGGGTRRRTTRTSGASRTRRAARRSSGQSS
jgi:hypothetical protein